MKVTFGLPNTPNILWDFPEDLILYDNGGFTRFKCCLEPKTPMLPDFVYTEPEVTFETFDSFLTSLEKVYETNSGHALYKSFEMFYFPQSVEPVSFEMAISPLEECFYKITTTMTSASPKSHEEWRCGQALFTHTFCLDDDLVKKAISQLRENRTRAPVDRSSD